MATYYTKAEARAAASQTLQKSFKADSRRALNESTASAKDQDRFDVFLSHSSKDADLILGVKAILESQGMSVYVDWVDDAQLDRSRVTRETADLLRKRMRQSSSLIWVASEAASGSKSLSQ